VLSNVPAAHGAVATLQASLLSSAENILPTSQATHSRSAAVVGAFDSPWLIGHVLHGTHACRPAVAAKALTQVAQARLLLRVGSAVVNMPVSHTARTVSQAEGPSSVENVWSWTHEAHSRLELVVASLVMP
jgi:hypothetical protein